ncbi:hypothetical protein H257_05172 [Aphanomyces astaci]|uniref:PhoD-like phosphatase metallophosphatase domain-containing protein n=1 Tax=Aphanomyces astaci TaxID=112090 RepID=W4GSB7_APHAT|nr:hypothetical protein H257_05172 [Aphanomyces astaci]ETV82577.1 hypothetical protein H257_05172 [Aphanomyces astaci]|eukprot:XP_009828246.1 hypothetical protein H257_05172 [Aphanomyces astaci]
MPPSLWTFLLCMLTLCTTNACMDVETLSGLSPVNWVWVGALTSTSTRLRVSVTFVDPACDATKLSLWVDQDLESAPPLRFLSTMQSMSTTTDLHDFQATGLASGASIAYEFRYDNSIVLKRSNRSVRLPSPPGVPLSYTFAFSSCADEDSDPEVFDEIASHDPLFFIHMGDLHYANLDVNDVAAFRGAYESMFASPAGTAMLAMELPMAYMWDDHDFGPDNSDGTALGRPASLQAYREYVPHYPLVRPDDPLDTIQQAFTIGRVRFLVTDLRSQRTPNDAPDIPSKTILGLDQKQWFKDQLQAATTSEDVGLVVWVNTMPWIDDERKWGHFTHEQNDLVAFFATLDLTSIPLVIVSGDAHMLAVDDGSHSLGNITTFHAAALGRPGSIKGGPYSHGAFPGSGQFGLLDVRDDGTRICVRYSGRRGATELLTYDTCEPSVPGTYTPYIPPSKPVRVVTRTLKKFLSRLDKKWQVVTRFYGWVAAMALVVGGIGGVVWWCGCHRSVGKPKHD